MLGWWKHKDDPNVLFLKYEDLKKVITFANNSFSFLYSVFAIFYKNSNLHGYSRQPKFYYYFVSVSCFIVYQGCCCLLSEFINNHHLLLPLLGTH